MRITSTVITAVLFLSGCVGGVDDIDTNGGTDAGTTTTAKKGKQNFIANVHPILLRCSGAGCHSQAGVTGMYAVSYTHLRAPRDGLLSRMPSSA